jgi:polyhydroxybutyrate depolymerase
MRQLADVGGFVVAQPAARGGIAAWNPQPDEPGSDADVSFIRELVDDVGARVPIDLGAVFASGFSNGGGMAHRLACDASDAFAAIGTVAGQYPLADDCAPDQPVALISFHGTNDVVVPITGVQRVLPDVSEWLAGWVERSGCAPVPLREEVAVDVVRDRWAACDGGVEVVFHTIVDGPHAWPGAPGRGFFRPTQSIDASEVMWRFFMEHTRS